MEYSTIVLSVAAAILAVYYFFFRSFTYFEDHGIPHLRPWPILGNLGPAVLARISMPDLVQKIYNLSPDAKYVGFYSLSTPIIILRDPELIKSIGVKNFDKFPNHHSAINDDSDKLVSKNLVVLRGKRWKEVRTLLSPVFTASKMKSMFVLMRHCASNFTEFLEEMALSKPEIDTKDIFTRYTNDVIGRCAFGVEIDSMKNPKNDFYVYGKEATTFETRAVLKFLLISILPKVAKWLDIRIVPKHIADFFSNVIQDIVNFREKSGTTQPDLIQLMMDSRGKNEDRQDLSVDEMTSQAFVFFAAGFETTSAHMCFVAHEIAANPDVQERLQREISEVFPIVNDEYVTYEAVHGMKYLDAVLNEALRLYPVAFVTDRDSEESFVLPPALPGLKEVLIKKGTQVWIPIYALQRDSKYYEEPDKFDPSRFLDDGKKNMQSGVYTAFGIGPRMCIGNRFALLETKILLVYLLARYNLKPCAKTQIPLKLSKKKPMVPENGFWLNIEPRGGSASSSETSA